MLNTPAILTLVRDDQTQDQDRKRGLQQSTPAARCRSSSVQAGQAEPDLVRVLSRTVDVRNAEATKGSAMMRTCLISACLLVASSAVPSFAEIYRPWCVVYSGRDSGARTCTFTSYEQCMMTAGPGTGGSCIQNPWFLWYGSNDPSNSGQGRRASGLRPYHGR